MSRDDRAGSYHRFSADDCWVIMYVPTDPSVEMLTICEVKGGPGHAQFVVDLLNDADEHGGRGAEQAKILAEPGG